jgi:hypothetical protein
MTKPTFPWDYCISALIFPAAYAVVLAVAWVFERVWVLWAIENL